MTRRFVFHAGFVLQFAVLHLMLDPLGPWSSARLTEILACLSLGVLCAAFDSKPTGRVIGALAAAAYLVLQIRFYRYYHTRIDTKVVESLVYGWADVWPVVVRALPAGLAAVGAVFVVEYAWLKAGSGVLVPRRRMAVGVAAACLSISVGAPAWAASLRMMGHREDAGASAKVPALPSTRAVLPNILVLLTESVRASDYCSDDEKPCVVAPEIDALLPSRITLAEMRSVASYTAVSVAAILTGRPPTIDGASRAPTLFEYMAATRVDGHRPTIAYWSAQVDSVLPRRDVRNVVDSFVAVDTLVGHTVGDEDEVIDQGLDRALTAHVEKHIAELSQPFVLFLHFQGTHAPYFTDDARAPFQPMSHTVAWSGLTELHDAYRDAIFEQDHDIAACVRAFQRTVGTAPYVVLLTSDHGEAFGEHGAIHHGQNLYEEQIHVPAFVAQGNGALDDTRWDNLRAYTHRTTTHLDILPTLLDVAGVLDGYALSALRKTLFGRSLVATYAPLAEPVPISNCTSLFPCPLDTWGVFDERYELTGQPWDADFRCTELGGRAVDAGACSDLRVASRKWFKTRPGGAPNR